MFGTTTDLVKGDEYTRRVALYIKGRRLAQLTLVANVQVQATAAAKSYV